MAIESTRDLCLSVADAIREKKGTSELINPQDFAKEIEGISGSGESGGSNWRYFKFGEDLSMQSIILTLMASTIKFTNDVGDTRIVQPYGIGPEDGDITAFAFNGDVYLTNVNGEKITASEAAQGAISMLPNMGIVEITETEYFSI